MGCNASMVFKANGAASFPESFRIQTLEVSLPLIVTSAPLWLLPITVSISKSPNRSFKSTIAGRSSISIRLGMYPLPARAFPRLLYCHDAVDERIGFGLDVELVLCLDGEQDWMTNVPLYAVCSAYIY